MKLFRIIAVILFTTLPLFANGLLMPSKSNYPYDFLRNTNTIVNVKINGLIAETSVYQEFRNEWYDSTDAVYSFPLPPDTRATEFIYWYNDKAYKAVLKVSQQAVNPGTGEGGIAAQVNKYIGRNGIKIFLKGIKAGHLQKVELKYVSVCDYYNGTANYKFPLNTSDFVTYPLDNLEFNINVKSNSAITSYDVPDHSNVRELVYTDTELHLLVNESKSYLNSDFNFNFSTDQSEMGVDFYSSANDSSDGHFALLVKPKITAEPDSTFPRRIIFFLANDYSMSGYKLSEAIEAVKYALDKLSPSDRFNILGFKGGLYRFRQLPTEASASNVEDAKTFLETITSSYIYNLQESFNDCIDQMNDENFNNNIYFFNSSYINLDPQTLESKNIYSTGIFPIGIGENVSRAKLEMTAALNYGFVTYIEENDNLYEKVTRLFDQTSKPLLKEVAMEMGQADVSYQMPSKFPSLYAGGMVLLTGRYKHSGHSGLAVAGKKPGGMTSYNFNLDFSETKTNYTFVEFLWAKMMIDALEWDIENYGENDDKKQQLIEISLKYNIRCRYTAYIADYENEYTTLVEDEMDNAVLIPESFITGNYPNPFNPSTTFRIFIGPDDINKTKLLRIYNSLGQLVAVIDISNFSSGWNEVLFNGKDMSGNILASGVYFAQLNIDNKPLHSIKINLIK